MEKSILQTILYADIFDYPLKAWEIHKWLIKRKCELPEVEKGLSRLLKKKKIIERHGFYVLSGRSSIVNKRLSKLKPSEEYMRSARMISLLFKVIPWIRFIGVSGNLAVDNADKGDDIDLFVITREKRLWLTRLVMLFLLALLEKRRRKNDSKKSAAGKFCLNLLVEENQLEQQRKNLYIAHEVLQVRPLWERDKMYSNFLQENNWAFSFIPNWLTGIPEDSKKSITFDSGSRIIGWCENIFRIIQLRYMGVPQHLERVGTVAVYFHPDDMQPKVLDEFEKRCKKYLK